MDFLALELGCRVEVVALGQSIFVADQGAVEDGSYIYL